MGVLQDWENTSITTTAIKSPEAIKNAIIKDISTYLEQIAADDDLINSYLAKWWKSELILLRDNIEFTIDGRTDSTTTTLKAIINPTTKSINIILENVKSIYEQELTIYSWPIDWNGFFGEMEIVWNIPEGNSWVEKEPYNKATIADWNKNTLITNENWVNDGWSNKWQEAISDYKEAILGLEKKLKGHFMWNLGLKIEQMLRNVF
jgi:hypothetical protein